MSEFAHALLLLAQEQCGFATRQDHTTLSSPFIYANSISPAGRFIPSNGSHSCSESCFVVSSEVFCRRPHRLQFDEILSRAG